jgi:hypothetical protein
MIRRQLELTVEHASGRRPLPITIDRLVVAGWVGRDKQALQHHIVELGKLGVPAPSRTPTYMNLSPMILTTADTMAVVGPQSSGEVECVLIKDGDAIYVGVGSDHTDRAFETYDIPASKQVCAKPVAPVVWELGQVQGHLEQIVLRSWMTTAGKRRPYQEGRLAANIDILEILQNIPAGDGLDSSRLCLFCGTFPAIDGIECGQRFEIEMDDPVLQRKISHAYHVTCLPQYL